MAETKKSKKPAVTQELADKVAAKIEKLRIKGGFATHKDVIADMGQEEYQKLFK